MTDATQMLHEIPDLAADVEATRYAPNPGDRSEKTSKPAAGSKPPMSLAMLHATMADGDADYAGRGLRGTLAMCVRLVVEEWADTSTSDIPDFPDDTWWSICEWLAGTEATWRAMPWADDIDSDIRQIHGQLRMLARAPKPEPRFVCSIRGCDERTHMQDGERWVLCEAGHQVNVEDAKWDFLSRQDWTLTEIRSGLARYRGTDIKYERLRKWHQRGHIKPIRDGYPLRFNFGAVCAYLTQMESRQEMREAG